MFTGIVQSIGQIARLERREGDIELEIEARGFDVGRLGLGDSACVQGVCLTVMRKLERGFAADVSRETLACTTLGGFSAGAAVNLEPAVRAGDALGGHLVAGHVDGVGRLVTYTFRLRIKKLLSIQKKHIIKPDKNPFDEIGRASCRERV